MDNPEYVDLTSEYVNMHEAKTRFSALVKRVESGEEVIVCRDGIPVAKLMGLEGPRIVPVRDAKTYFSALVKKAEDGQEVIIRRADQPVARIVPLDDSDR